MIKRRLRRLARRFVPSSLGARLFVGALAMIVVALTLTGLLMEAALTRFVRGQVDGRIDGQILTVVDALRLHPDGILALERSVDGPPFDRVASGWCWEVLSPEPVLRSRSLDGGSVTIGTPEPAGPRGGSRTADAMDPAGKRLRARLRHVEVHGKPVTIVATAPLAALRRPLREALRPLVIILVVLGVALLGGVVAQIRLGLRPLGRLRGELAKVRTGRAPRVGGRQPREVRPLVDELNLLLDENAANLERARRNVANLAHGLKTPLAALAMATHDMDDAARAPLGPLVDRMDRLIRHHLARARTAALGGASRARVRLSNAVGDHVTVFAKLQADKGLIFDVAVAGDAFVAVEAQDLDEILGNLLDNASKWARTRVAVSSRTVRARVELTVDDDGPGIPDDRIEEMMMPGRRIDEGAPGHGFGLTIARELIELHGGSLSLSRATLGGLRAILDLPSGR